MVEALIIKNAILEDREPTSRHTDKILFDLQDPLMKFITTTSTATIHHLFS